jgi:hypothetical protein
VTEPFVAAATAECRHNGQILGEPAGQPAGDA